MDGPKPDLTLAACSDGRASTGRKLTSLYLLNGIWNIGKQLLTLDWCGTSQKVV